jgi:3-oxoacyl-[acyl-carrier-protein] synthase II
MSSMGCRPCVRLRRAVTDHEPLDVCHPFQEGGSGSGLGKVSVAFVLSAMSATPYVHLRGGVMGSLVQFSECFADALVNADVRAHRHVGR